MAVRDAHADGADIEAQWSAEILRRVSEIKSGAAELVDWDTAREQLRAELRERRRR